VARRNLWDISNRNRGITPGGQTREQESPPYVGPPEHLEYGQQQIGPGYESYWSEQIGGDWQDWLQGQDISNLGDMYNWFEENPWQLNFDFWDYYNSLNPHSQDPGPGYGGGAQGGSGDLGLGSYFAGGGMGADWSEFGQSSGGGTIDPNISDCESMYNQSGGFDFTQLSYSEFSSMYC